MEDENGNLNPPPPGRPVADQEEPALVPAAVVPPPQAQDAARAVELESPPVVPLLVDPVRPQPRSPVSSFHSAGSVRSNRSGIREHRHEMLHHDARSFSVLGSDSNDHISNSNNPELDLEDPHNPACGSGWSEVDRPTDPALGGVPPSPRSLHAGALLNETFYTFGGYDGSQRVNTFHAFSFANKRWSPVFPSANSTPPPTPRDRHVAVAFGNMFYVHGGFDGTSRVADFWGFDFSTMTWREVVHLSGRLPSPRHSHSAAIHAHSMYIFGGYDGAYKSDLHEFDFATSRWSAVPAVGRRPRARYRATCVVHKNSMILYGGHDGTRHLSDTHVFDLNTRTWSTLVTEGSPPAPRDSHVSVIHSDSMYVFGGSSGHAMNDLHELVLPADTAPAKWRVITSQQAASSSAAQPNSAQLPTIPQQQQQQQMQANGVQEQPRRRFCHVAVVHDDAMFAFGGYDGIERLNDFVRFDFAVHDLNFEVPPSTLLSDLRGLINDSTLSDVTFIVEGREDSPIYAHKLMLVRCPYFESLFLGNMREARESTIRIEQVSHSIFLSVIEYLYTDRVRISINNAMELFQAADLFCLPRLKIMCEKRMLQALTVENAAAIFHAAEMHSATALRQKTKRFILNHFEAVSKSVSFEEMGRSNIELVFELLKSR